MRVFKTPLPRRIWQNNNNMKLRMARDAQNEAISGSAAGLSEFLAAQEKERLQKQVLMAAQEEQRIQKQTAKALRATKRVEGQARNNQKWHEAHPERRRYKDSAVQVERKARETLFALL